MMRQASSRSNPPYPPLDVIYSGGDSITIVVSLGMNSLCRVVDESVNGRVRFLGPWDSWIPMEYSDSGDVTSLPNCCVFNWDPGLLGGIIFLWCVKVGYEG